MGSEMCIRDRECSAHPYFEGLRGLAVSAHFMVRRDGELLQFVSCDERAWHAGASSWRGRTDCNDCSIGIEMEGLEGSTFEAAQYRVLCGLLDSLCRRYAIAAVTGHEHVAPGRKSDPGSGFDWLGLSRGVDHLGLDIEPLSPAAKRPGAAPVPPSTHQG